MPGSVLVGWLHCSHRAGLPVLGLYPLGRGEVTIPPGGCGQAEPGRLGSLQGARRLSTGPSCPSPWITPSPSLDLPMRQVGHTSQLPRGPWGGSEEAGFEHASPSTRWSLVPWAPGHGSRWPLLHLQPLPFSRQDPGEGDGLPTLPGPRSAAPSCSVTSRPGVLLPGAPGQVCSELPEWQLHSQQVFIRNEYHWYSCAGGRAHPWESRPGFLQPPRRWRGRHRSPDSLNYRACCSQQRPPRPLPGRRLTPHPGLVGLLTGSATCVCGARPSPHGPLGSWVRVL